MSLAVASDPNQTATVDLDSLELINITEKAQYILDHDNSFTFSSLPKNEDWQPLNRQQLRFGFIDIPVWLKIQIKTKGSSSKSVNIDFNKNIDKIDVHLLENNIGKTFIQRKAVENKIYEDHYDHEHLTLKPDSEYQFLIRLESKNSINGMISLENSRDHISNKQTELMLYLAYAIALLMIIFYNTVAYIATKSKAFWYHSVYGLSVLAAQLSQYGYLNSLLGIEDPRVREILIITSFSLVIISIIYFAKDVLESKRYAPRLSQFFNALIWVLSINLILSLFLPFKIAVLSMMGLASIGLLSVGIYIAMAVFNKNYRNIFCLYLTIMSVFLMPPALLLMSSRLALIDQTFISEYLLLIMTPFELVMISSIIFFHIRRIEKQVSTAKYIDPETLLPNKYSLKESIEYHSTSGKEQTLVYIWLSSLSKMQMVLESSQYRTFMVKLINEVNDKISQLDYVHSKVKLENNDEHIDGFGIFNADRDTFALLINNTETDVDNNHHHLQEIKSIFKTSIQKILHNDHLLKIIKPTIAACNFKGNSLSPDTIMEHCSLTLSRCVKTNVDQLVYDENLRETEHRNALLTSGFTQAMQENQFFLQWQPQFNSQTNLISGMEALIRWEHPHFGLIPPDDFISLLEDSMQIKELTHWVIKSVFNQATEIRKHFPDVSLSINLSVYDFLDDDLLDVIDHYLSIAPLICSNIIFEVTETVMIEDDKRIIFVVEELQKRGFKVSIDDFGAGHASFGYLQNIPANELKIDKRFSMNCDEKNSQTIIKSIINIAQQLSMKVVIEGVEEQYQADLFKEWGAEYLQGWLFAKPMHLREIIKNYS
ncbi:MAG: EAL domain-containing protein [Cocleimonas sp.]